jgi:hypothetical protein
LSKIRKAGADRMAQVVEKLPSKCEALTQNPVLQKKMKREKKKITLGLKKKKNKAGRMAQVVVSA